MEVMTWIKLNWYVCLEKNLFDLVRSRYGEKKPSSWRDLGLLLNGYNIFAGVPHVRISPRRFS